MDETVENHRNHEGHGACLTAEFLARRIVYLVDHDIAASAAIETLKEQLDCSDVAALRRALLILAKSCMVAEIDEEVHAEMTDIEGQLIREFRVVAE